MMISNARARAGAPLAAFLIAAALTAGAAIGHAQEGEGAAMRNLESEIQKAKAEMAEARKGAQKAEAELRRTDSLLREEVARAAQADDRQAKDRERREKENASLQARLQETQGKINAERAGLNRHQNAQDEIKARQKRLSLVLAGYCDSVASRIEAGPPWEREGRLDRVRSLKKDLEAGSATVDEGFARLNAAVKEEIKGGDEIALLNKPVTRKNGDVVNAQVMKIGNQWLVYMDDEGKHFGVLERKPAAAGSTWTWEWREDPGFEEKNRIKAAIEVKSSKRPPSLAMLDLGLALGAGNASVTPTPPTPPTPPAAPAAPAAPKTAPVKGGK
jgi:uncharacterized protein DUF3450